MHPCLTIDEILRNVFEHSPKSQLPALALTCRAFLEPCLDLLWHEQLSFVPLIQCMPTDLWTVTVDLESRRNLVGTF